MVYLDPKISAGSCFVVVIVLQWMTSLCVMQGIEAMGCGSGVMCCRIHDYSYLCARALVSFVLLRMRSLGAAGFLSLLYVLIGLISPLS